MRILVYSDVHANWEALQAMDAFTAGRYDASLCLGDVVGYGADPIRAIEWVRERASLVVRGNHDRAVATLAGIEQFNPTARDAARWTHHTLPPASVAWLKELPAGPLAWNGLNLAHGSPLDEDQYLLGPDAAAACFAQTSFRLQWFGHTHVQTGFRRLGGRPARLDLGAQDRGSAEPVSATAVTVRLQAETRYLLNPGSVGQPRDGDWRAAFALLDEEAGEVEFHRIPYDLEGAQARILAAGLPTSLAQRLAHGW